VIFTASDLSSISRSLHRWELTEYISEAFVVFACAGELVGDLGERWLGDERKRHIERRSTILLVVALSVSLIALLRTNELSGNIIGSLGDKAAAADTEAQAALEKSGTAEAKADEAERKARSAVTSSSTALGQAKEALDKAGKAQSSASNALTLASGARKEADDANAAAKQAFTAAKNVEEDVAWRRLTEEQEKTLGDSLKPFPISSAVITYLKRRPEEKSFASDIHKALGFTDWKVETNEQNFMYDGEVMMTPNHPIPVHGVLIVGADGQITGALAGLIATALQQFGFDAVWESRKKADWKPDSPLVIQVEPRPPGAQGVARLRHEAEAERHINGQQNAGP